MQCGGRRCKSRRVWRGKKRDEWGNWETLLESYCEEDVNSVHDVPGGDTSSMTGKTYLFSESPARGVRTHESGVLEPYPSSRSPILLVLIHSYVLLVPSSLFGS
jgi:hypothetical protein